MNGLTAYGAYVPYHRLSRAEVSTFLGSEAGPGSRAVASYDEDTTSMGVEAARNALRSLPTRVNPERVLFATAAPAYLEKTNANALHAALGLEERTFASDLIGSVRSGVGAMVAGADSSVSTLVVLADVRVGLPGSLDEREGGDGAAALLFGGADPVIAECQGFSASTTEFLDRWRLPHMPTARVWEERFGEYAYRSLGEPVLAELLKSASISSGEIDQVIVTGLHGRAVRGIEKTVKDNTGVTAIRDVLKTKIGNLGTAHPAMLLADALDRADPNETIALLVVADGVNGFLFRTTDAITGFRERRRAQLSVVSQIEHASDSLSYGRYLSWRGLLPREPPRRPDPNGPAAPPSLRSSRYKYSFIANKCTVCNTIHLPAVRVCVQCKAVDEMVPVPMANAQGRIATYTVDRLAFSPSPPVVAAVVDFEGGGRLSCELTDVDPESVSVGDRVEMTFRRFVTAGGIHNYFWKARPMAIQPVVDRKGES